MSALKASPGPWYVTEAAEDLGYCRIREVASDYVIATADDGGHVDPQFALPAEQIEANARLIAAAPELYEALELFVRAGNMSVFSEDANSVLAEAHEKGTTALAKARGE